MVTIEQKLTLFSKLLNQDIKEEMDEKFIQLEREYEKRIAESKFNTDKEAEEIIEQATRRAEIKKVEMMSKGRLSSKKELMQVKEEMIEGFMKALQEKVVHFTNTSAYLAYLERLIGGVEELRDYQNPLVIYLTKQDYDNHQTFIQKQFVNLGINKDNLKFEVLEMPSILGGVVIVDPQYSTRIDMSMLDTIEEAKEYIIHKISKAIGEVGEITHD